MPYLSNDVIKLVLGFLLDFTCVKATEALQKYLGCNEWVIAQQCALSSMCPHNVKVEFWLKACDGGNFQFCTQLAQQLHLTRKQLMMGIHKACSSGWMDIVRWCEMTFQPLSREDISLLRTEYTSEFVCLHGHLDAALWLKEKGAFHFNFTEFMYACSTGYLHLARWILEENPSLFYYVSERKKAKSYILEETCKEGQLHAAKWLVKTFAIAKDDVTLLESFRLTCANGHLDMLKWLVETFEVDRNGVLSYEAFNFDDAFLEACVYGHLLVVEWIYHSFGPRSNQVYGNGFSDACANNKLNIVKWIHETCPSAITKKRCKSEFSSLCQTRYTEIIKWLVETYPFLIDSEPAIISAHYSTICERGSLQDFIWMNETFPCIGKINGCDIDYLFQTLCKRGDLDLIELFYQIHKCCKKHVKNAFPLACITGHLHVAKWLAKQVNFSHQIVTCYQAFDYACKNGHLHIAQWIYSTFTHIITRDDYTRLFDVMKYVSKTPDVEMMKWISQTFNFTPELEPFSYRMAFKNACIKGRLEDVKWIAGQLSNNVIHRIKTTSFHNACLHGQLHIAQWIAKEYSIDDFHMERGMELAQENGQPHVADWLLLNK